MKKAIISKLALTILTVSLLSVPAGAQSNEPAVPRWILSRRKALPRQRHRRRCAAGQTYYAAERRHCAAEQLIRASALCRLQVDRHVHGAIIAGPQTTCPAPR